MTNFEKIAGSKEALAEYLGGLEVCPMDLNCPREPDCVICCLNWLNMEAGND